MTVQSYNVTGMTCGHCVQSVTEEVSALPGVQTVEIDLPTGALTVHSDETVTAEQVRAAVEEAGYTMAGTP